MCAQAKTIAPQTFTFFIDVCVRTITTYLYLLVAVIFIHVPEHHEGFLLRGVLVGDTSKSHDRQIWRHEKELIIVSDNGLFSILR